MASFDPLDREILQKALDAACAAVKDNAPSLEFDSDESLEAALWRELIELVQTVSAIPKPCATSSWLACQTNVRKRWHERIYYAAARSGLTERA